MPDRMPVPDHDQPSIYEVACMVRRTPTSPALRDAYTRSIEQSVRLHYALRELPRDGRKNEPKRLRWDDIKTLVRPEAANA
jgi:hypothetical protein